MVFAPESPHGYVLNAEWADQLAPCVAKHRVSKQMKASAYNTKFAMYQVYSGYAGVNSMQLTTHSDHSSGSELLAQHEDATIVGRNDINLMLSKKVEQKKISPETANSFTRHAAHRFSDSDLRKHAQGATYVKINDMIAIHLFESSFNQNISVVDDRLTINTRQLQQALVNDRGQQELTCCRLRTAAGTVRNSDQHRSSGSNTRQQHCHGHCLECCPVAPLCGMQLMERGQRFAAVAGRVGCSHLCNCTAFNLSQSTLQESHLLKRFQRYPNLCP